MKINIQAINFSYRQQLYSTIEKKLKKLKRLCDAAISIDIKLTLNRQSAKVNKLCGIRLVVPGYDIISNTRSNSFEAAVAKAVEALERQVEKRKTKMRRQLIAMPVLINK